MANVRIANATAADMLIALLAKMNAGSGPATCKIYTATQPANADTAIGAQTLLATLTFTDPAASSPSGDTITFSAITEDSTADATGTATWARIADSNGTTVFDCDAGTSSTTIILNTASVVAGGVVRITSATLTIS